VKAVLSTPPRQLSTQAQVDASIAKGAKAVLSTPPRQLSPQAQVDASIAKGVKAVLSKRRQVKSICANDLAMLTALPPRPTAHSHGLICIADSLCRVTARPFSSRGQPEELIRGCVVATLRISGSFMRVQAAIQAKDIAKRCSVRKHNGCPVGQTADCAGGLQVFHGGNSGLGVIAGAEYTVEYAYV